MAETEQENFTAEASDNIEVLKRRLDHMGIRYAEDSNPLACILQVPYTTEHLRHLVIVFAFDDNMPAVHVFTSPLLNVPQGQRESMLPVLNATNRKFRWLSFSMDDDGDIAAEYDCIIPRGMSGKLCPDILNIFVRASDEAYVDLMRGLWGNNG